MTNNKLALNQSKTQIMVVSKHQNTKYDFNVTLAEKNIKHKNNVVILGNTFSHDLSWDNHISKVLIPSVKNRVRTLRILARYLPDKFRANIQQFNL